MTARKIGSRMPRIEPGLPVGSTVDPEMLPPRRLERAPLGRGPELHASGTEWWEPRRSMRTPPAEPVVVGAFDNIALKERQMADQDDGLGARTDNSSTPWDEMADQAHDDGQAVLDALARRARRLGRRIRRTTDAPVRILKLMD